MLNHGECGKNELYQKILNLLKDMQLLESSILQKSETIVVATDSVSSFHNAISNHINEVFILLFKYLKKQLCLKLYT